ncbi:MAG: tail fiber domain-containing protein, partial [Bacteroidota bacterium]|nr:tail fiber domain-containing protein [Bacteroidota bacterium]
DNALERVMKIEPKQYEYRTDEFPGMGLSKGKKYGFIAQDLAKVFPELSNNKRKLFVSGKNKKSQVVSGYYTVDYESLIPVLVKAIQEQQEIINKLEKRVDELENSKSK